MIQVERMINRQGVISAGYEFNNILEACQWYLSNVKGTGKACYVITELGNGDKKRENIRKYCRYYKDFMAKGEVLQ